MFWAFGNRANSWAWENYSQSNMALHQFNIVCSHACDLLHINYRRFNNLILVWRHLEKPCKITETISLQESFHTQMIRCIAPAHTRLSSVFYHRHSTATLKCPRCMLGAQARFLRRRREREAVIEREMLRKASRSTCLAQFCCVKSSSSQNKAPKAGFSQRCHVEELNVKSRFVL